MIRSRGNIPLTVTRNSNISHQIKLNAHFIDSYKLKTSQHPDNRHLSVHRARHRALPKWSRAYSLYTADMNLVFHVKTAC